MDGLTTCYKVYESVSLAVPEDVSRLDHGDRFLNEFVEFIQKPVPMISDLAPAAADAVSSANDGLSRPA